MVPSGPSHHEFCREQQENNAPISHQSDYGVPFRTLALSLCRQILVSQLGCDHYRLCWVGSRLGHGSACCTSTSLQAPPSPNESYPDICRNPQIGALTVRNQLPNTVWLKYLVVRVDSDPRDVGRADRAVIVERERVVIHLAPHRIDGVPVELEDQAIGDGRD